MTQPSFASLVAQSQAHPKPFEDGAWARLLEQVHPVFDQMAAILVSKPLEEMRALGTDLVEAYSLPSSPYSVAVRIEDPNTPYQASMRVKTELANAVARQPGCTREQRDAFIDLLVDNPTMQRLHDQRQQASLDRSTQAIDRVMQQVNTRPVAKDRMARMSALFQMRSEFEGLRDILLASPDQATFNGALDYIVQSFAKPGSPFSVERPGDLRHPTDMHEDAKIVLSMAVGSHPKLRPDWKTALMQKMTEHSHPTANGPRKPTP